MFESDEALLILGSVSQRSMNIWDFSAHMQLGKNIPWTSLNHSDVQRNPDYMRRKCLIELIYDISDRGKVYRITDSGRELLVRWVRQAAIANRSVTFPFDLLINAIGILSLEERHQLINRRKAGVNIQLEHLVSVANELPEEMIALKAIFQHHVVYFQAELNWLDDLVKEVNEWDNH